MTGIEKIIAHIQAESEAAAKTVTDAAEAEVQEMLAAAEQKEKLLAANEDELNEAKLNEANTAAQSAARLAKRRVLLSKRGELIAQVIADAQKQLEELPDGEAVAFLLKLAAQCAGKAEG
ncbi:MAG: V-type ATP synthase subunit E family protein, partial [Pygmaiobacter massiliensis]